MALFGKKKISYSLLRYNKSLLNETKADPLAVIVESGARAIIIGRAPASLEGVSLVGQEVLGNLRYVLEGQATTFGESDLEQGLIHAFASANAWNLSFSEPSEIRSDSPLEEVAFMLFGRHIMRGQVAERAERTGRPQARSEKVELFEVATPVGV